MGHYFSIRRIDNYLLKDQPLFAAFGILLAFGPPLVLLLARKSVGELKTSAWLVTWGAFIAAGEHAIFSLLLSTRFAEGISIHARYHFFMAAIFTIIGVGAITLIAHTLLQEGRRSGWYAILAALILGGGFEFINGSNTFFHGIPPDSILVGLALYAYIFSWISALVIAYKPIFND